MKKYFFIIAAVLTVCLLFSACSITAPKPLQNPEQPKETEATGETVYPDTELSIIVENGDFSVLDAYPNLAKLNLSGSSCYDDILDFISAHPNIDVIYTVPITGNGENIIVENKDTSVTVKNASYIDCLVSMVKYLPSLGSIDLGSTDADKAQIDSIREAYSDAAVTYSVNVLGKAYDTDAKSVDLRGIKSSDVDAVCTALELLPQVEKLPIADGAGAAPLSYAELAKIAEACPTGAFDFSFTLFNKTIFADAERVEYVKEDIKDEGVAQLREVLPFMNHLSYLLLDECGISNEVMAQLRDDFPDIKVVWRVTFSGDGYNTLTDTEKIWATGSVTDGYTSCLKYCTDVKYMDLGHNCITNIDFVNYMPKLEVLVISITWVESIDPLANCPNLEYLEVFNSRITNIEALKNCTKLKHVNVSFNDGLTDLSPLYGLEDPERIRVVCLSYVPQEQIDKLVELYPDCNVTYGISDPSKSGEWRWVNDEENGERVPRYALLCEQFGYDDLDYSR